MPQKIIYNIGDNVGDFIYNGNAKSLMVGGIKRIYANFICHCGKEFNANIGNIKYGGTKSCGCGKFGKRKPYNITKRTNKVEIIKKLRHGERALKTPEYRAWQEMIQRCENKNRKFYHLYGGRGIIVCQKWRSSYQDFLKDMGRRPSNEYSLDRINVNGNYEPSNCRWATIIEQANNKTNSRYIEYNNVRKTLTEWCRDLNLSRALVQSRLKRSNYIFNPIIFEKNMELCQLP